MTLDPHKILLHPYVTEKAMDHMTGRMNLDGTPYKDLSAKSERKQRHYNRLDQGNKLEFIVHRKANKHQIKQAFEEYFKAKVVSVNTRHCKDGKHAIIKLDPKYSAEEIGMNIGIF